MRDKLSAAAFAMTAEYDRAISGYFAESESDSIFTTNKTISMRLKNERTDTARIRTNRPVFTRSLEVQEPTLLMLGQLNGKDLSYNNLLDLDAALHIVRPFAQPACSVIKHNNPCGAVVGETLVEAARKGMAGDPRVPLEASAWIQPSRG